MTNEQGESYRIPHTDSHHKNWPHMAGRIFNRGFPLVQLRKTIIENLDHKNRPYPHKRTQVFDYRDGMIDQRKFDWHPKVC